MKKSRDIRWGKRDYAFMAMHTDQLRVDERTVRKLVDDQFAQWRALWVEEAPAAGTVNAIFRIGSGLAARFALRAQNPAAARTWLMAEAASARELAAACTVPTPEQVAVGCPGEGYPLPWSVHTWLSGNDATVEDPEGSTEFAHDLAALITSLRTANTRGRRFNGTGRGGHLPDHDEWMEVCFRESAELLDVQRMRAIWAELRTLPEVDGDVMCHGDLTPPNVLVREGRLVGVLDGGGFSPGDPALDLVAAWHLLDDTQRGLFREALACSDIQWCRGMAWAFLQAMGLIWYYVDSNRR